MTGVGNEDDLIVAKDESGDRAVLARVVARSPHPGIRLWDTSTGSRRNERRRRERLNRIEQASLTASTIGQFGGLRAQLGCLPPSTRSPPNFETRRISWCAWGEVQVFGWIFFDRTKDWRICCLLNWLALVTSLR